MGTRTALFSRKQPGGVFTIDDFGEHPGNIWFVDSGNSDASDTAGFGQNPDAPFATIDYAVGKCTANNGDVIYALPGHTETVSAAGGLDLDVAGIKIVFLGEGSNRATIKFGTDADADMDVDAANITLVNPRFEADIDALTGPIDVNAANFTIINGEWHDGTQKQTKDCIIADANADYLFIDGWRYFKGTAGTQQESHIQIAGATKPILKNIDIVGDFDTGAIENGTAWVDAYLENVHIDNQAPGPVVGILLQATSSGSARNCHVRVASGSTYITADNDMQWFECYGTGTDATGAEEIGTMPSGSVEGKIDTLTTTVGTPTDTDIATDIANVQTEVDKIGSPTDTDIATDIANVQTEVDKIGSPAGASVSADIAAVAASVGKSAVYSQGVCDSGMAGSTTTIVCDDLAGYGDDFFNNQYYMQVLHNDNSAGNAPEKQVRQITDYVSATGTFTTSAFGANVEGDDIILVLHESAIAVGRDDADNAFASTNVASNADGSMLERQEYVQETIGTPTDTDIATDIANVKTEVDKIGTPADTDVSTDIANVKTEVDKIGTPAGADVSTDIANVQSEVDKLDGATLDAAPVAGSVGRYVASGGTALGTELPDSKSLYDMVRQYGEGYLVEKAITLDGSVSYDVFTVTGVVEVSIVGYVTTDVAAHADNISLGVTGDTAGLIAATAGTAFDQYDMWVDGTPALVGQRPSPAFIGNGADVKLTGTANIDSGAITFYCFYRPISNDGAVTAAA